MIQPVQAKLASYFHLRSAIRGDCARDLPGRENNFRKFGAFENFAMHLLVAASVSGVSAGRVHDNGAADFAAGRIETDRATFEGEFSMHRVHVAAERKFNLRLRRVELNDGFLCPGCGRQNECGHRGGEREEELTVEPARRMDFTNHKD